ncbi:hypothetical protein PR202_gb03919 [Eleusine coracana subsp. coracana]|uniref:F-box protein n=1 Tax=Eleusine coracana subsp. coracana TaxID=191504 RepID=A0AAV5E274_ELECO|nr:hypothetical protein PR202_gb03919 [Eleusine coracana subsp. coracana]
MGEVAALRQLVGQVQELWDLYGANAHPLPRQAPPPPPPPPPFLSIPRVRLPRSDLFHAAAFYLPVSWYLLDFEHGSIKDDYCGGRTGYNSELLKIMESNQSPPRKRPRRDRNRRSLWQLAARYFMCTEPDGVLSYDGRVMLVGLLCKNAATCVCIWELQKMTLLWKEVDRMPNIWCLEFYGKHMKMTCLGNSGLLMLSLKAKRMNRLVTYNLSKRSGKRFRIACFRVAAKNSG